MNSIQMINRLPSVNQPWGTTPGGGAYDIAPPTARERLDEVLPLIDVVPEAGPPIIFVLGPWLLVVMMLIGPFVLLVTVMLATAIFTAIAAAIVVLPYLLIHHVRERRAHHHHRAQPTGVRVLGASIRARLLPQRCGGRHAEVTSKGT